MATPDNDSFNSLSRTIEKPIVYKNTDRSFLNDLNNNLYGGNTIRFDTTPIKDQFIVWADTDLVIPLTITNSTAVTAANYIMPWDTVAYKTSVLDLISQIQINVVGGGSIVNESNLQWINYIRLLAGTSNDAVNKNLQELGFCPDSSLPWHYSTNEAVNANGVSTANREMFGYFNCSTTTPSCAFPINDPAELIASYTTANAVLVGAASTSQIVTGKNSRYNEGFAKRIKAFKSQCIYFPSNTVSNNGGFYTTAVIPLKYLHPFFANLTMPISGLAFNFIFTLASGTNYVPIGADFPFLCSSRKQTYDVPANAVPAQAANNTTNIINRYVIGNNVLSGTSLQYRRVTLDADESRYYVAQQKANPKKRFVMNVCDVFNNSALNTVANTSIQNVLITSSSLNPQRVWTFCLPSGFFSNGTYSVAGSALTQSETCRVTNNIILSGNILINNVPYYQSNLGDGPLGRINWKHMFDDCTLMSGYQREVSNNVSISDFNTGQAFQVFDISRTGVRGDDLNKTISLTARITLAADPNPNQATFATPTAASDVIFIVERKMIVEIDIDKSTVMAV